MRSSDWERKKRRPFGQCNPFTDGLAELKEVMHMLKKIKIRAITPQMNNYTTQTLTQGKRGQPRGKSYDLFYFKIILFSHLVHLNVTLLPCLEKLLLTTSTHLRAPE